jgi:hypothetical protein
MGVATGTQVITTNLDIPSDLELGDATLEVVANGIPSDAVKIEIVSRKGDG